MNISLLVDTQKKCSSLDFWMLIIWKSQICIESSSSLDIIIHKLSIIMYMIIKNLKNQSNSDQNGSKFRQLRIFCSDYQNHNFTIPLLAFCTFWFLHISSKSHPLISQYKHLFTRIETIFAIFTLSLEICDVRESKKHHHDARENGVGFEQRHRGGFRLLGGADVAPPPRVFHNPVLVLLRPEPDPGFVRVDPTPTVAGYVEEYGVTADLGWGERWVGENRAGGFRFRGANCRRVSERSDWARLLQRFWKQVGVPRFKSGHGGVCGGFCGQLGGSLGNGPEF